jgi:hypothetical protein
MIDRTLVLLHAAMGTSVCQRGSLAHPTPVCSTVDVEVRPPAGTSADRHLDVAGDRAAAGAGEERQSRPPSG